MGRAVLAVIAGYLAIGLFVFLTFTGLYLAIGADRAFRPGTYEVSVLWIVASLVLGTLAAFLGGRVCAAIAKRPGPPRFLAGLVLVLGFAAGWKAFDESQVSPPRTANVSNLDAMQRAELPAWFALIHPLFSFAGVLAGARGKRPGRG